MVKNRAAIYARFSSHNQRSESIEIQVENSRAYCEREGLQVVREYCDYAQTGRNVNRAEFQRMMNDAKLGLFDFVVIYKVTRIMRNRDEMALARIMLRKAGVEILYAGEEIASGSSGVLQLGMLEVLAEWESAIDSERIRDGIQKNAARCLANGHSLYGWDIVDGRYSVNEREAALMRKMKNMLFSGHSVADIVRALEGEKTRNGKPFNQDKVTKLLRRVQNGGTYSYAGHVVEGGMPGLWPQVEQDMIESVLNDRHRPRRKVDSSKEFPLSGKLYCTKCGMPMAGMSGTSKTGKAYHYYRCRKCRRTVRRDLIEDAVVDMTLQAVARDDVRQRIAQGMALYQSEQEETKPKSYYLKKELRRIDAAFERIWQAIEDGIAPPGGKERTDELKCRKAEIEAQLRIAERDESMSFGVDELMLWLDEIATELTPLDILNKFVRFAEIDGKSNRIRVYFAFDKHGDGFSPNSADKGEHLYEERCSPNSTLVVLRMGKLSRVAGPGLYFTIPILEHGTIRVDQRTIATPFYAEKTLTADLVPVTVDAVLFWMVWDAEKACVEVEDYYAAVSFLAQTAMREAVGRSTVAEVALRRDQLDQEIKEEVEREAAAWGIGVISVKVRDIVIPDDLQHVMSLEAQADREKNARMTVASAEADMADMLAEAASAYGDPSAALRLRTMLQQYETVKASKGTVVTVPSALSDSLADAIDKEGQR